MLTFLSIGVAGMVQADGTGASYKETPEYKECSECVTAITKALQLLDSTFQNIISRSQLHHEQEAANLTIFLRGLSDNAKKIIGDLQNLPRVLETVPELLANKGYPQEKHPQLINLYFVGKFTEYLYQFSTIWEKTINIFVAEENPINKDGTGIKIATEIDNLQEKCAQFASNFQKKNLAPA